MSLVDKGYKTNFVWHERVVEMTAAIADYLAWAQEENGTYPARSFYAETFSVLLWSYLQDRYQDNIDRALARYSKMDKMESEFHWEFNNFALLKYFERTSDERVRPLVRQLKFKGTPVTNWVLLRAACRFAAKKQRMVGWVEMVGRLLRFQKMGFIFDNHNVRSFQYHCFSAALLAEIHGLTKNRWLKRRFLKAVDFISHFIMPNGDTLYVGRGQQQIFGYGCLIFILAYAFNLTGRQEYLCRLERVLGFVGRFQRRDGSFPLVLRKEEKDFPIIVNTKDPRYCGWYAYNNYFDYLPFFGYWLARTADLLKGMKFSADICSEQACNSGITYIDGDFLVFENENYKAVISKPGGYWTNDMPIPYVCYQGVSITPCYGGEQFVESIYSREGIPLPFGKLGGQWYFFRDRLNYKLKDCVLIGYGDKVRHERRFEFKQREIVIKDHIGLRNCSFDELYCLNMLVFARTVENNGNFSWVKDNVKVEVKLSRNGMVTKESYYSACGKLKGLRNFEEPTGDSICTEIVIEMEKLP